MGTAKTIATNFLSLTAANAASKVFGLAAVVYLARNLGPADFGLANAALAATGYFAMLSHLGVNVVATRDLARGGVDMSAYVSRVVSLKFTLGLASFALLAALSYLSPDDRPMFRPLMLVYGLTFFTTNVLPPDWVFLATEEMGRPALATAGQSALYALLAVLLVAGPGDLLFMPLALLAAQAAAAAYLYYCAFRRFPGLKLRFDLSGGLAILREAAPLGLSGFLAVIVSNTGLSLLGVASRPEEAGYLSAAGKISGMFSEALMAYSVVVLPPISRYFADAREKVEKLVFYTFKALALFGLPAAAGVALLAPDIIELVFGGRFGPAGRVLSVTAWNFLFTFGASMFYYVLVAAGRQNRLLLFTAVQAAAAVLLNLALIGPLGALGAALAGLATSALAFLMFAAESRRLLDFSLAAAFARPALAAAAMSAALYPLRGHSLAMTVPAGAAVYALCALGLGAVSKEEFSNIRSIFKGEAP